MIGQTISHYKITAKLGEGGMGVVYRAEDKKLDRAVALKFIAANLIKEAEARKRFEREAKAAAGVSHANVCHVYEISETEEYTFLAMEFVDGESLDKRIERGPLPLKDALEFARQAAEGLAAAHEHGVVHRDIKPGNLLLTPKGQVKILDFGLALLTEGSKLTQLDTKVGTVAYMSPEQAQGMEVDRRSDIWSVGCVLYEMVCGQRPFRGVYDQALLYEIINQGPEPLTGVRAGVPMELEWIAGKCLAKDADNRYQNAADLVVDLKNLQDKLKSGRSTILRTSVAPGVPAASVLAQPPQPSATTVAPIPAKGVFLPKRKVRLFQGLFALSVLAALALAFVHFREAPPELPLTEFAIDLPADARIHTFSLSPDGRHVALALDQGQGGRSLWVRSLNSIELRELAGTEGAQYPFWSPDSRYIGFFAQRKLKKVALAGGPPQSLCDADDGRGGTWNTAGEIVFAPAPFGQVQRVPEGGGEPVAVTTAEESGPQTSRRFPSFLPDGQHFLYTENLAERDEVGIYLGSIDEAEPRRLLPDSSNAIYAAGAAGNGGFILFFRERTLMAQPFDESRLEMVGDAFPVVESVGRVANDSNYGYSVSNSGSLLYLRGGDAFSKPSQLAWFDRAGKQLQTLGDPLSIIDFSLSPDETRAALSVGQYAAAPDIWLFEFARGTMSRFTTRPGAEIDPSWSPDGKDIAFASQGEGYQLYRKSASEAEDEQPLLSNSDASLTGANIRLDDWSPDGRFLLYRIQGRGTSIDLWALPLEGDRRPFAYLDSEFLEANGRFSPDGRWVAYDSDESGRMEVYVRPFPAADRKWRISTRGGSAPNWSKDGRELYYLAPGSTLMAVPLKTSDTIDAGSPQKLFQTRLPITPSGRTTAQLYDVSRDCRFLIANRVGDDQQYDEGKLVIISDWRAKVGK